MRAYLTQGVVSRWLDMEACSKVSALWYENFVLPKDTDIDQLLSHYSRDKDIDALRSIVEDYPSSVQPANLSVRFDQQLRRKITARSEEEWGDFSDAANDEDWDDFDDETHPFESFGPQLGQLLSGGALKTYGVHAREHNEAESTRKTVSEVAPISVSSVIATPLERDLIGRLKLDKSGEYAISHLREIVEIPIPDLRELTWSDVLDLRKHYHYEHIRAAFGELAYQRKASDGAESANDQYRMLEEERRKFVKDMLGNPLKKTGTIFGKAAPGAVPGFGTFWSLGVASLDAEKVWSQRRRFFAVAFMNELEEIANREKAE